MQRDRIQSKHPDRTGQSSGIEAGRRAGMIIIAVPSVLPADHPGIVAAELVRASLEEFSIA